MPTNENLAKPSFSVINIIWKSKQKDTYSRILYNPFYYGDFEYPKGSGNWYQGKHEPIITKELFDQAHAQLKSNVLRKEDQEFAFTKLMTCGLCDSGISAAEKWKKHKNGNVHRYVYYGCTKAKDTHCKCGYIEEKELIKQFENLLDKIDLNELSIKEKIKEEVERFKKFQRVLLNRKEEVQIKDIDIRAYTKYILRDGNVSEKRELLGCLNSEVVFSNKKVFLKS